MCSVRMIQIIWPPLKRSPPTSPGGNSSPPRAKNPKALHYTGKSFPPPKKKEPTNEILKSTPLYILRCFLTVVVVVVVCYATPAPVLCARFASDFANTDFANNDVANGDGRS